MLKDDNLIISGLVYNENNNYISNSVTAFQAYYWYTKWTNDPTDCDPDFDNTVIIYDDDGNIIGLIICDKKGNQRFKK